MSDDPNVDILVSGADASFFTHADDVAAGFTTYTYPAALKMMHARATGGDIAMAGVDLGGGAPAEGKAAVSAELAPVFKIERREYLKSNYSAVSLRPRPPRWFRRSRPTFGPQSPRRGTPMSSSSPSADDRSRPKWCMYFNEPDASHASQVEGKSAE
jgi:hypothetical protein